MRASRGPTNGESPDDTLASVDPELYGLIESELGRERATLDMVASQNLVTEAVLEAQGSILTNKYADGYPGARLYDGCEFVDAVEALAVERCRALFGAEHANVQPYSGANANAAVLQALAEPGDAILGFDFEHGGHPSQHDPVTVAGRFYDAHAYHVRRADGLIDMEEVAVLAERHRPAVIFTGGSCYPRHLDFAAFRAIADSVGAFLVADMAHISGLVAAGLHPDPVPVADVCTFTTHKTLAGARGGAIICRADLAERIDAGVFPGDQGGPLPHVIAAKAVTFLLCQRPEFAERMARTVTGARGLAAVLAAAGAETQMTLVTGGTDIHLFALDTYGAGLDAVEALECLHRVGITGNAMRIAYDRAVPPGCSGLRLGTAALATRGFSSGEFVELGAILVGALGPARERRRLELTFRVGELAGAFPLYPRRAAPPLR